MTLDLAKKLKDAGLDIHPNASFCHYCFREEGHPRNKTHCPSLSELIEACGEDFEGIQHGTMIENDGSRLWYAATYNQTIAAGHTPEESVANLWLALNEKKRK